MVRYSQHKEMQMFEAIIEVKLAGIAHPVICAISLL
jgi:hypothetical protein